jgi:NADH dehydrogenase
MGVGHRVCPFVTATFDLFCPQFKPRQRRRRYKSSLLTDFVIRGMSQMPQNGRLLWRSVFGITDQSMRSSAMSARIYKPARNAMQSGQGKTTHWVLEHAADTARDIDPLMGWTSSSDTQTQVKLRFPSKEAALDYAKEHGIEAIVQEPHSRKPNIRAGGYGENFATNRRGAWTH